MKVIKGEDMVKFMDAASELKAIPLTIELEHWRARAEAAEKAILSVQRTYIRGVGSICNFCQGYECLPDCVWDRLRKEHAGAN